jgi:hypothetical protein
MQLLAAQQQPHSMPVQHPFFQFPQQQTQAFPTMNQFPIQPMLAQQMSAVDHELARLHAEEAAEEARQRIMRMERAARIAQLESMKHAK